jgi:3'-phosphoadenosine 5'-phosphosulfate (PAPS) 3'-phosphatase
VDCVQGLPSLNAYSRELEVAMEAAKRAAELALQYQANIVAETKPEKSPVTQADRECELLIARMLSDTFPDDGILGEDGARTETRSGRRWIIDPIDGTRDYVRGNPLWANLIALEEGSEVVAGVVNLPILGKLYTASHAGWCALQRLWDSCFFQNIGRGICSVFERLRQTGQLAFSRSIVGLDGAFLGSARLGRRCGRDDGGVRPSRDLD